MKRYLLPFLVATALWGLSGCKSSSGRIVRPLDDSLVPIASGVEPPPSSLEVSLQTEGCPPPDISQKMVASAPPASTPTSSPDPQPAGYPVPTPTANTPKRQDDGNLPKPVGFETERIFYRSDMPSGTQHLLDSLTYKGQLGGERKERILPGHARLSRDEKGYRSSHKFGLAQARKLLRAGRYGILQEARADFSKGRTRTYVIKFNKGIMYLERLVDLAERVKDSVEGAARFDVGKGLRNLTDPFGLDELGATDTEPARKHGRAKYGLQVKGSMGPTFNRKPLGLSNFRSIVRGLNGSKKGDFGFGFNFEFYLGRKDK